MMRSKFGNPARFAAVAVAALMGIGVGVVLGQNSFTDVQVEDPRRADISYASEQGWFRGYPDGSFRPDRLISEEQLARVIRRAHPGLTRGDAAVFLRGGIDRLREAGITTTTTTTTTTVATTAAAPAGPGETGGPGGGAGGPGGDGPADPNPPVVVEPTAPATETTTATTAADGTTTTTAAAPLPGARNLFRYGFETGWTDFNGRSGSHVWSELAIRDYSFPQDAELSNWWQREGYANLVITGMDSLGQPASREWNEAESGNIFVRFTITDIRVEELNCGGREGCVAEGGLPMPTKVRDWANGAGYSKVAPATTTTTTTTTAAAATTTLPTGRYVAYGREGGWVHYRSKLPGNIIWWERRNWDEASPEVTVVMSNDGTIISEDPTEETWFTPKTSLTVREVSCDAECAILETSTMPARIRDKLLEAGYTRSDS